MKLELHGWFMIKWNETQTLLTLNLANIIPILMIVSAVSQFCEICSDGWCFSSRFTVHQHKTATLQMMRDRVADLSDVK